MRLRNGKGEMTAQQEGRSRGTSGTDVGAAYDREQVQFMTAMSSLKRKLGRMPAQQDVFAEALRIGYRKTKQ